MPTQWRVSITKDETANDSDKIFTVPAITEWQILWIWVEYTSSSVAGTRQLEVQFQDSGSSVIGQWQPGITQGENLTYKYLFGVGVPDLLSVRDTNYIMTPMIANTFLSSGQKIRIWDNNVVDSGYDDMIVEIEHGYHEV